MSVPSRLLFVPGWLVPARACEEVPGIKAAIDEFRKRFEVETYSWPWTVDGRRSARSWEEMLDDLRSAMGGDRHVVTMGAATLQLLLALKDHENAAVSLTCAGFSVPPGTLRSIARNSEASAASAMFRWQSSYQYVRLVMAGADEDMWTDVAHAFDVDVDWAQAREQMSLAEELDLEVDPPRLQKIPTLYLDSPLSVAGFAEMTEVFLRYAPNARVERLSIWPGRLQDPESGLDLARKAIAFIRDNSS
jgi:hypothetical protein